MSETAVAKRPPMQMGERGFDFDFENMQRFANALIEGGMVPKSIKSPGAVVGIIEAGKELGLPPMYALANLTFTNGRLGIMGDAAKALIRNSGALEPGTDFEEVYSGIENTPEWKCTVSAHRAGQSKRFSRDFSIADAVVARLVRLEGKKVLARAYDGYDDKGPWATYTKRMLMYRALGFLVRDYFSDSLCGFALAEEIRDIPATTERGLPPSEPDPLLAAVRDSAPQPEIIEAETVDSVSAEDAEALRWLGERADDAIAKINKAQTLAGEHQAYKSTTDLRIELAEKLPQRAQDIEDAHTAKRRELGVKE